MGQKMRETREFSMSGLQVGRGCLGWGGGLCVPPLSPHPPSPSANGSSRPSWRRRGEPSWWCLREEGQGDVIRAGEGKRVGVVFLGCSGTTMK